MLLDFPRREQSKRGHPPTEILTDIVRALTATKALPGEPERASDLEPPGGIEPPTFSLRVEIDVSAGGPLTSVPLREVLKCFRGGLVVSGVVRGTCGNAVTTSGAGSLALFWVGLRTPGAGSPPAR